MDQEDADFALALKLQQEENKTNGEKQLLHANIGKMSIVDPQWELIDPNPDIQSLFLQFNDHFFFGKLSGIEVKYSSRMTLCAGLCLYERRAGFCSVRLSAPLLRLRPRKDLVETLLHEMIHALLFVTHNNRDHDSHGPEFHKHMHRINKETGTNITVYHTFHDEVDNYRQHWWRCDGPCQSRRPYFGYVKRAMNRAPSARDPWWSDHQRTCGGTYTKVKEPENYGKKTKKSSEKSKQQSVSAKNSDSEDIRKFLNDVPTIPASHSSTQTSGSSSTITNTSSSTSPVNNIPLKAHEAGRVLGGKSLSKDEIREARILKLLRVGTNSSTSQEIPKAAKRPIDSVEISTVGPPKASRYNQAEATIDLTAESNHPSFASPLPIDLTEPRVFACPVCRSDIKESLMNSHLDDCLS